jgi:hypothetical protein
MFDKTRTANNKRLEDIKRRLPELDRDTAVQELLGHIDALEDELTMVYQYYEEFLLPQLEGTGWAARLPRTSDCGQAL